MTRLLRLYTREGCHLCTEAESILRRISAEMDDEIRFERVDIDADPALVDRFTVRVPVVELDGIEVAEIHVDETAVRLALRS